MTATGVSKRDHIYINFQYANYSGNQPTSGRCSYIIPPEYPQKTKSFPCDSGIFWGSKIGTLARNGLTPLISALERGFPKI